MKNNIKISLNHDYLSIKDERHNTTMQLPIRTAQLIADMWQASGNGDEEIISYAKGDGSYPEANPSFDLSVFVRQLDCDNVFKWIFKVIDKL